MEEDDTASPADSFDEVLRRVVRSSSEPASLPAGTEIGGRFRIDRVLGAGGMGTVYAARDHTLGRDVAIKLHHAAGGAVRLRREAVAMARLAHPNVVTVFEVGELEQRPFVVMEYVAGTTLRAWLREGPRTVRAIVDVMVAAGEGLAAAHDANLIHRDIKPENILIGSDGRARVGDFGLARGLVDDDDVGAATHAPALGAMTQTGAVLGTPAYMAPEQLLGKLVDARADQFSFCVTLWEALWSKRPFVGDTVERLISALTSGDRQAPPAQPRVPARIKAALERGLARAPEDRFATIHALLAELREPQRRRRVLIGGVVGGALVAGAAVGAMAMRGGPAPTSHDAAVGPTVRAPPAAPVVLTSLGGCAYSPAFLDDTTVVFDLTRDGAVDLYRVAVDSSAAPVRLTSDPGWEWRSSRGRSSNEVVFMWQSEEGLGIDTLDLPTAKRHTLFPAENGPVLFAGDSFFHAPSKRSTLRRFHAGRDEILATIPDGRDVESMASSRDASHLALMLRGKGATYQLCLFEVATAKLACTSATPHGARPAFSATSMAVYFDSAAGIQRIGPDRTTIDTMIPGVMAIGGIAVSPSGRSLVYSDCRARSRLLQFADNQVREAEPEGDMPAIGRGGMRAFVRASEHGNALVIRNADGMEREVTRRENRITNVTISHDGRKLAYVVADSQEPGIYLSEIRGNAAPNRLTDQAGDGAPLFFGDSLVFTRWAADGTPHVFQVRLDGSAEAPLARRPRISVDADAAHGRILISSPNRDFLYWLDPTTGTESPGPLLPPGKDPADLALSPDGRWLLVLGGNNGHQIWRRRVDVPDAKAELVHQLGDDVTALAGSIDDDGHPLIAVDSWIGELWLSRSSDPDPW